MLQRIPTSHLELSELNSIEDAKKKLACGELEQLEKWPKFEDGLLRFGVNPNNNNALTLSNPTDTKVDLM